MPDSVIWLKDRWFIITAAVSVIAAAVVFGAAHQDITSKIERNTEVIKGTRTHIDQAIINHERHPHIDAVTSKEYDLLREDIRELKNDVKKLLSRP